MDEYGAKENKLTYDAPLKATVRLVNKALGSKKEQTIFLADFPIMTEHGTFIINGVERVIVPQLARSFGVFFSAGEVRGKTCFGAKVIPARGAWIEIDSEADGAIFVKIDRKRKFPVTTLLRVLGATFDRDTAHPLRAHPGRQGRYPGDPGEGPGQGRRAGIRRDLPPPPRRRSRDRGQPRANT